MAGVVAEAPIPPTGGDDPVAKRFGLKPPAQPQQDQIAQRFGLKPPVSATEGPGLLERAWQGMLGKDVSRAGRFGMGVADPAVGAAQTLAHAAGGNMPEDLAPEQRMLMGDYAPPPQASGPEAVKAIDQAAQGREQSYQSAEKKAGLSGGLESEWARLLGGAVGTAPIGAAAGAAGQGLGMAGRLGAATAAGAAAGLTEPVADPRANFAAQKAKQAGLGAAGGLAGGAAGEAISGLAGAIAGNSKEMVDKLTNRLYQKAVRPSLAGDQGFGKMDGAGRRLLTVFDDIGNNKNTLKLTDPAGNPVIGKTPKNLEQFAQAISQRKSALFSEWDAKAAEATGGGARVSLDGMTNAIREAADRVRIAKPELANSLEAEAERYGAMGSFTPSQAQNWIATMNQETAAYWRNPNPNDANRISAIVDAVKVLNKDLDDTITSATGPGYKDLRQRWSALKSVESDVAKATLRDARNVPGGLIGQALDAETAVSLLHSMLDPTKLPRAGALALAKQYFKRLKDPNRAIARIFEMRESGPAGPIGSAISQGTQRFAPPVMGSGLGSAAADLGSPRPSIVGP